ncbi:glycine zipper 2TM domain-containing protein [Phenylobacterium sp. J426]|uniref:glycine zipper 2TM domain-containing protein n=1 Tax=Phenylobacterium sp. J426 TaxID=2898439 RepID=UPI002150B3DA|nr:glycine zipper 2TM domain-containing protein [Phenylobacterium sp. J426]MCR5876502.1 glycine zipper 2TM domain-containing protein [Phenylobacterium sp. J426]
MRIGILAGAAVALAALPRVSDAACPNRTTGTVVGAVAGGLLGNAVAGRGDRTEGALIGAAVGGLAGNQLTKCKRASGPRYAADRPYRQAAYASARPRAPTCRYESRAYYDHYGQLVQAPAQVCR